MGNLMYVSFVTLKDGQVKSMASEDLLNVRKWFFAWRSDSNIWAGGEIWMLNKGGRLRENYTINELGENVTKSENWRD
jgi:hypothetical protein